MCGRICLQDACLQAFWGRVCRCNFLCLCGRGHGRFLTTSHCFTATFLLCSNNNTTKVQLRLQFFLHVPLCERLAMGSSVFWTLSLLLAVQMRSWMLDGLVLRTLPCGRGSKIPGSAHLWSAASGFSWSPRVFTNPAKICYQSISNWQQLRALSTSPDKSGCERI